MTTVRRMGRNLPCSGGGWFRVIPYAVFRSGLRHVNGVERSPGIFYFHPWEVDPDQPRITGCGWKSRIRHYTNLSRMAGDLDDILHRYSWGRMDDVYSDILTRSASPPATATAPATVS